MHNKRLLKNEKTGGEPCIIYIYTGDREPVGSKNPNSEPEDGTEKRNMKVRLNDFPNLEEALACLVLLKYEGREGKCPNLDEI